MGYVLVTDTELEDIGDAIRSKTGENATLTLSQMASAIGELGGGGGSSNIILLEPLHFDLSTGYVSSGTWVTPGDNTYADVYEVENGHKYWILLGPIVSNRFRTMFTSSDPALSNYTINGTMIGSDNDTPTAYVVLNNRYLYSPPSDGYLTIGKTNNGTSGIKTYVLDVTNLFI